MSTESGEIQGAEGRSTGPLTSQGKARASANALKHGALCQRLRFQDEQEGQEFAELLQDVRQSFRPVGRFQELLVDEVATIFWKLGKLNRWEQEVTDRHGENRVSPVLKQLVKETDISKLPLTGFSGEEQAEGFDWECREMTLRMTSDGANKVFNRIQSGLGGITDSMEGENPHRTSKADSARLEVEIKLNNPLPTILRYGLC